MLLSSVGVWPCGRCCIKCIKPCNRTHNIHTWCPGGGTLSGYSGYGHDMVLWCDYHGTSAHVTYRSRPPMTSPHIQLSVSLFLSFSPVSICVSVSLSLSTMTVSVSATIYVYTRSTEVYALGRHVSWQAAHRRQGHPQIHSGPICTQSSTFSTYISMTHLSAVIVRFSMLVLIMYNETSRSVVVAGAGLDALFPGHMVSDAQLEQGQLTFCMLCFVLFCFRYFLVCVGLRPLFSLIYLVSDMIRNYSLFADTGLYFRLSLTELSVTLTTEFFSYLVTCT